MSSTRNRTELPLWTTLYKIVRKIQAFPRDWPSVEFSQEEAEQIKVLMTILKNQDLDEIPAEEATKLKKIILKLSELRGLAELQAKGRIPSFMLHFDSLATQAKFTLFKKLPRELRDMIWRHAIPKSRVIELYPTTLTWNPPSVPSLKIKPGSHTTISRLLAVCKESQAVVLRKYKTHVLAKDMSMTSLGDSAKILLDFKNDILYYSGPVESMTWVFNESSKLLETIRSFGSIALKKLEFDRGLLQRRPSQRRRATSLRQALQRAAFQEVVLISERDMRYSGGRRPGLYEVRRPLTQTTHQRQSDLTQGWERILRRQMARGELTTEQKEQLSGIKFAFFNRIHPALLYYLIREYIQMRFHVNVSRRRRV